MSEARQRRLARAVGRSIGAQRERAGLTQDQVSEMLGIGSQAVSRMERGAVMPTLARLFEFADVFDCRVDELLALASDRGADQVALVARDIGKLGDRDRELVVGVEPGQERAGRRAKALRDGLGLAVVALGDPAHANGGLETRDGAVD